MPRLPFGVPAPLLRAADVLSLRLDAAPKMVLPDRRELALERRMA